MISDIMRSRVNFEIAFNKEPEYLYVGRNQMLKIRQEARENIGVTIAHTPNEGMEVYGLKVIEVLEDDHFNIC